MRVAAGVAERRPQDALGVDALVGLEGAVLGGDHRVLHVLRHVGQRDRLGGSGWRTGRARSCRRRSRRRSSAPGSPCSGPGCRWSCRRRRTRPRRAPGTPSNASSSHFSTRRSSGACVAAAAAPVFAAGFPPRPSPVGRRLAAGRLTRRHAPGPCGRTWRRLRGTGPCVQDSRVPSGTTSATGGARQGYGARRGPGRTQRRAPTRHAVAWRLPDRYIGAIC